MRATINLFCQPTPCRSDISAVGPHGHIGQNAKVIQDENNQVILDENGNVIAN